MTTGGRETLIKQKQIKTKQKTNQKNNNEQTVGCHDQCRQRNTEKIVLGEKHQKENVGCNDHRRPRNIKNKV